MTELKANFKIMEQSLVSTKSGPEEFSKCDDFKSQVEELHAIITRNSIVCEKIETYMKTLEAKLTTHV